MEDDVLSVESRFRGGFEPVPEKGKTFKERTARMKTIALTAMLLMVAGCITPFKEPSGKFVKVVPTEDRSSLGTNLSFGRLARCEGPDKKVMWYSEGDFTNCVLLTKAEQDEWMFGYSRGAGPEIIGAAIVGGSIGAGAALGGANAAANAGASASNTAIQTVTGKHHRR